MSKLFVEEKEIVVPGEKLGEGMDYVSGDGTFREGDLIIACRLGLVSVLGRVIKIIPLAGSYIPKKGDVVVGYVVDVWIAGWQIDIGWPYYANLGVKDISAYIERGADLTKYCNIGDVVCVKIINVVASKLIDVSMRGVGLKKLIGGRIIEVCPYKVPRIIGRQGTMISMIKEKTGCNIVVGQNGRVWIYSSDLEKVNVAAEAIEMIDKEAHKEGLTDKIKEVLERK